MRRGGPTKASKCYMHGKEKGTGLTHRNPRAQKTKKKGCPNTSAKGGISRWERGETTFFGQAVRECLEKKKKTPRPPKKKGGNWRNTQPKGAGEGGARGRVGGEKRNEKTERERGGNRSSSNDGKEKVGQKTVGNTKGLRTVKFKEEGRKNGGAAGGELGLENLDPENSRKKERTTK